MRSSNDLQNGGQHSIVTITHVGYHFLGFGGWRIWIWGQIEDMMLMEVIEVIQWPPKWRSKLNSHYKTCWVSFPRFLGKENPNLRSVRRLMKVIEVIPWPPKWRSTRNSHYNTCWVSFPRFLGMGNWIWIWGQIED